jgi:hypothetical protein
LVATELNRQAAKAAKKAKQVFSSASIRWALYHPGVLRVLAANVVRLYD